MAFAAKMIIAAVAALTIVSQVSCKPLAPYFASPYVASAPYVAAAPVATAVTTHTVHPAVPVASTVTHVASPAVVAHAPVAAVSSYHYPGVSAYGYGYPGAYSYPSGLGYPSALSYPGSYAAAYHAPAYATAYHAPYAYPAASTTILHK